jgi:omega-hydroxy-beta-dihydromenaquinone-9 sulfotransferase
MSTVVTAKGGGEAAHWYSPTFMHTMTAGAWWRLLAAHGFRVRPSRWSVAVSVTFTTANNSLLGLLQSGVYGGRLRATSIEHDPIFVLGHWRSGTTHLHELLTLDDRFAFPTTFECFAPHHCVLTGRLYPKLFSWLLPSKRTMDNVAVGFDRPQEDEFALIALGAPSPYWSIVYPGEARGQPYLTLRDVPVPEREKWISVFQRFLRLLTYQHQGKPLILKSPTHTARLAMLARMFPKARFVHIVRDPHAVFASTVHLWRNLQSENALAPMDMTALEAQVIRNLLDMYDGFETARAALQPGRFHQIRYEDLVREPLPTLEQCYHAIGLSDFTVVRPRIGDYLSTLSDYRTNEYAISPHGKAAVNEAWGAIFRKWGYAI